MESYSTSDMIGAGTRKSVAWRLFCGAALASLVLMAAACGDSNTLGPDNQVQVDNVTDSFQWQASDMAEVSQTLTYTWTNTGTTANVDQSSSITAGSATLRVTDDRGEQVYSSSLSDDGTFQTNQGASGDWTVTVELSGASGTANFRLQAP